MKTATQIGSSLMTWTLIIAVFRLLFIFVALIKNNSLKTASIKAQV